MVKHYGSADGQYNYTVCMGAGVSYGPNIVVAMQKTLRMATSRASQCPARFNSDVRMCVCVCAYVCVRTGVADRFDKHC